MNKFYEKPELIIYEDLSAVIGGKISNIPPEP